MNDDIVLVYHMTSAHSYTVTEPDIDHTEDLCPQYDLCIYDQIIPRRTVSWWDGVWYTCLTWLCIATQNVALWQLDRFHLPTYSFFFKFLRLEVTNLKACRPNLRQFLLKKWDQNRMKNKHLASLYFKKQSVRFLRAKWWNAVFLVTGQ